MTKIKITKEQYEKILIREQSERLLNENSENSFNHNNEIIMGFAKILGLKLTKQNSLAANKAINNIKTLSDIKLNLLDADKREKLIQDLESKGMVDPTNKIIKNYQKIVNNFNKYASELKMEDKLKEEELLNHILRK